MLEKGPTHLGLVSMVEGQADEEARQGDERGVEDAQRLIGLDHGGRVDDVLGGRTVVEPPGVVFGDTAPDLCEERDERCPFAPGSRQDRLGVGDRSRAGVGHLPRRFRRGDAGVGQGEGQGRLEAKHRLDPARGGEHLAHLVGGESRVCHGQKSKNTVS
jgi:hypothetical protein